MHRATVTRGLAAGPDRFDGRSRYNVGLVSRWGGTNSDNVEGACPVEGECFCKNFVVDALAQSLLYGVGGVIYPYPTTGLVFGTTKKRVRESRMFSVYPSNCESVLFMRKLVGVLLSFTGEVAVGEMVAVEALMSCGRRR